MEIGKMLGENADRPLKPAGSGRVERPNLESRRQNSPTARNERPSGQLFHDGDYQRSRGSLQTGDFPGRAGVAFQSRARSEGVEKGSRLFRIYRAAHGSELASE